MFKIVKLIKKCNIVKLLLQKKKNSEIVKLNKNVTYSESRNYFCSRIPSKNNYVVEYFSKILNT